MKTLYIMSGIPGSGKSTFAKNIIKAPYVSLDEVRKELYGKEEIQGDGKKVFSVSMEKIHRLFERYDNVVYDATNINPKTRKNVMKLFPDVHFICIYCNTPIEICKQRNAARERKVPVEVINRMYNNFVEPTIAEGFEYILKLNGEEGPTIMSLTEFTSSKD